MKLDDAMDLVLEAAEGEAGTMRMKHYERSQIEELESAIEIIRELFAGLRE